MDANESLSHSKYAVSQVKAYIKGKSAISPL